MDIDKQIEYWVDGTPKAWRSVPLLRENGFYLEALFYAHLAVEKALKAHVAKVTQGVPPYIHNLLRLTQLAELEIDASTEALCEKLTKFQGIARYPDITIRDPINEHDAKYLLTESELLWKRLLEML